MEVIENYGGKRWKSQAGHGVPIQWSASFAITNGRVFIHAPKGWSARSVDE